MANLREALNEVEIVGILSEIDLKYGSYVNKQTGQTVETIGGHIKVLVEQTVNGEEQRLEIPVHMFSPKLTKKGTLNPSFQSIETVMNEYTSIAAAGGKTGADKIKITKAKISANEYYNQNNQLVSFPRIQASFVSRNIGEFKPHATFEAELAIVNLSRAVDKDGIELEPAKLNIGAVIPQFGGKVTAAKFVATTPNVIDVIEQNWEANQTVAAHGRLHFTSSTETIIEDTGFGEPIEKTKTISISELVITGGLPDPLTDGKEFDVNEINVALQEREEKLRADQKRSTAKKAPAPATSINPAIAAAGNDLGF